MTRQGSTNVAGSNRVGWRVLDIKNGQLRLISDETTADTVKLHGANGYNNAVKILDDLCNKLYSNVSFASNVQNLKIEDIQEHMNEKNYKNIDANYGNAYTPGQRNYPNIFAQENRQLGNLETGKLGFSEQDTWYTGTNNDRNPMNTTYTFWSNWMEQVDFTKPMYYELFIDNGGYNAYWLSSRCIEADAPSLAYFHVRFIASCLINGVALADSSNAWDDYAYGLRPVITLKSNLEVAGGNDTAGWDIQ